MRSRVLAPTWKRFGGTEGNNLVEGAIVLPLVISVMFAIVEFAGVLYAQQALQNGVNLATRYAITRQTYAGMTREQSIRKVMKDETPTLAVTDGQITFQNMPLTGGAWTSGTGPPGSIERITVTYTWQLMTPILYPFVGAQTLTIQVHATMKNESELQL